MRDVNLETRLKSFIEHKQPNSTNVIVRNIERTSAGFARENWIFDAEWTNSGVRSEAKLMMRRDPGASILHTDRVTEFGVLRSLNEHPEVLAPQVFWLDESGEWLGHPAIVMERIPRGTCDWFVLNNASMALDSRLRIAENCIKLLGNLHNIHRSPTSGLYNFLESPDPNKAALREVENWALTLEQDQLEPYPDLQYILNWLMRHAPVAQAIVPVHGDFKPGNML